MKNVLGLISILIVAACGAAQTGSGAGGGTTPAGGGGGDVGGGDVGSVTIRNGSNYGIYQLHMSPSDNESWGADLLAGDPLLPGEGGTVLAFDCAKYDLKMVDDEDVECVVQDIDLCLNDEDWTITDAALDACATAWAD